MVHVYSTYAATIRVKGIVSQICAMLLLVPLERNVALILTVKLYTLLNFSENFCQCVNFAARCKSEYKSGNSFGLFV
jgi:hypothetical protein